MLRIFSVLVLCLAMSACARHYRSDEVVIIPPDAETPVIVSRR
jgi:hypothetical protein